MCASNKQSVSLKIGIPEIGAVIGLKGEKEELRVFFIVLQEKYQTKSLRIWRIPGMWSI